MGVKDIFEGAEKVEILGKLPIIMWTYLDTLRSALKELQTNPDDCAQAVEHLQSLLSVMKSAAMFLANTQLQDRIDEHDSLLTALVDGQTSPNQFVNTVGGLIPELERLAGPRPESMGDRSLTNGFIKKAIRKVEHIKRGRSGDIVVSADILQDIRAFLITAVMMEGISSIMVIDNAGTLIAHVGDKVELDAVSLAAVAAANFAATEKIARLIGEQDFVLLFYKGHNESFHFSRIGKGYIIVTIFNNSLSLGLLRLRIAEGVQELEKRLPTLED